MRRGDVVIINFPFSDRSGSKRRPELVVQADALNARLHDTVLATITTNRQPSQTKVLIDVTTDPQSGLHFPCAVKCENLATVEQSLVLGTIGMLSSATMRKVDKCLRRVLGV